jgi:amino acid adenylation domain-containing protein
MKREKKGSQNFSPLAAREFWREVLEAGGTTTIPAWTLIPQPGVGEHLLTVPDKVVEQLTSLLDELEVPLSSALLAAHGAVLAALTAEPTAVVGYRVEPGHRPLPCRLASGFDSWRTLITHAHRVEQDLLRHARFPLDQLAREIERPEPTYTTVFDPTGTADHLEKRCTLQLAGFTSEHTRVLRLRYRADVLDASAACRIAGYHLAALEFMGSAPDTEPSRCSLLSPEELRHQLRDLIGDHRPLPDRRFHEQFEDRVRKHPDAVAASLGERHITYRQLNSRANRLARVLLAHGLGREGVVAVICDRNIDWLISVLAVLKSGGAYLPVEPHLPVERIRTMLARAEAQLLLTEPGTEPLARLALSALPQTRAVSISAADSTDRPGTDLGLAIGANELAYIFFTSGSTGEPKGAMCEHAGMLNHLYAKIDALDIGEGMVVAQTAPQSFDISLWQLLSGLLVGGRTLLITQDLIVDPERLLDTLAREQVAALQVVPSYLEALLAALEAHPRRLPDLRRVSVTGETLRIELVRRWFAAQPTVPLVNAYGLTETSDDTNHEVMYTAPASGRVALGRPIPNARIYVVDEHLAPVPLGAPGEIVFAGICVGRGYVNDPERTRRGFVPDPNPFGGRLYRSGDRGRWNAEGSLEFLGRADSQIKIRGFRVELGEIEAALLCVPGIRQAEVVVSKSRDRGQHLIAFYRTERPLAAEGPRDRLAEVLPSYMVPSSFHRLESMPLTPNGKVDRKALLDLARQLAKTGNDEAGRSGPTTASERRIAKAWASVLGVPITRVGRHDNFFDLGGTSLTAVKLAVALNRAVALPDITRNPVLADLANLIDGHPGTRTTRYGDEPHRPVREHHLPAAERTPLR